MSCCLINHRNSFAFNLLYETATYRVSQNNITTDSEPSSFIYGKLVTEIYNNNKKIPEQKFRQIVLIEVVQNVRH
jgi:hypothetical protein